MKKNTEKAFVWIVGILNELNIQFQISGGFAARLYGADRELADIDIGVADKDITKLFPHVKKFVISGPERYKDQEWDLDLMTLEYEGQVIDISGEDTGKFFNKTSGEWILDPSDITDSEIYTVYGMAVPVIRKDALIAYKKLIGREVDIADVRALTMDL